MDKKLVREYLLITFGLMLLFWGGCVFMSQAFGLTADAPWVRIPYVLGGFSPTVASYVSLKRAGRVKTVKKWLRRVFDVRHSLWVYGEIVLFVLVYYVVNCLINGFTVGAPAFLLLLIVPLMLFGGGNEEAGWRMVLQPELEKALGFHPATLITGVVWWVWHLPLFFIHGTANQSMNFFLFGILCLALSYALATVRRTSNGVFPCVLTHCLINGLSATLVFHSSLLSATLCLTATLLLSLLFLKIEVFEKKDSQGH